MHSKDEQKRQDMEKDTFKKKITDINPCPAAWTDKADNGHPVAEMGYFRADYDGCRWWNTVWPINKHHETPELIAEFDSVLDDFFNAFPSLSVMTRFAEEYAEPTADSTEYNAYLDLKYGYYWMRMRTIPKDYNLYLHCISKAALKLKDEMTDKRSVLRNRLDEVIAIYKQSCSPAEAVSILADSLGCDEAAAAVATLVNSVSLHDGRIYDGVREWAQNTAGAMSNEEIWNLNIYGVDSQIHTCHVNQLGMAMRDYHEHHK